MNSVAFPPYVIRCKGQNAEGAPNPVIQRLGTEKRPVTTIMLDHEQAHQKDAGWHAERQRQPIADRQRPPGGNPERDKKAASNKQFQKTTLVAGCAVGCESEQPILRRPLLRRGR